MEVDSDTEYDSDQSFSEPEIAMDLDSSYDEMTCLDYEDDMHTSTSWNRTQPPELNPETDSLIFQQIDIKSYTGIPRRRTELSPPIVPILRMFGVTMCGNSVCCNIYGYFPYFYVSKPNNFQADNCKLLRESLNTMLSSENGEKEGVLAVELVDRYNIYGYNLKEEFIQITLVLPRLLTNVKRLLKNLKVTSCCEYFESNIDFNMRFMVDSSIVGCNWIELPPRVWSHRTSKVAESFCQIEVDVNFDKIISHKPEADWSKVAPFRILSLDIECAHRKGIFPVSNQDSVIQIANVLIRQGESEPFVRTIFTLKSCAPVLGSQVISFDTEEKLLEAWSNFIRTTDPDILTGYNINNFDLKYLISRAQHWQVKNFHLGRIKNIRTTVRAYKFESRQLGNRKSHDINFEGRVTFDLWLLINREYKLRSYTLNAVSYHFLQEQKEDFHPGIITDLQNESDQSRSRLAKYCLQGALLPIRLLNKLMCIVNYIEMARVSGVSLEQLLHRGQQIKVLSQLLRTAKNRGYILPAHPEKSVDFTFEGGTVLEAKRGYYSDPIAILDFASMYPSIMITHNLCFSTLLQPGVKKRLGLFDDQITTTPANYTFVKETIRKGLLPEILESLLAARKITKTVLANERDPVMRSILDGRQLAIKLLANSVYGFTGAQNGKQPCLQVSCSVTAYGREMIEQTKMGIEKHYTRTNGYKNDARIIYGDTDSVMVRFGLDSLKECMDLGREAAAYISSTFPKGITLEYENIYCPYLLISKKHYAGLYFSSPDKHDKVDCRGLEVVRRDCPLFVSKLLEGCLHKLLIDRDRDGAVEHTKRMISDLLCNRIDISQLVITKQLTKEKYNGKHAHVQLAKKMKECNPGTSPKLGDRVPYIMCAAPKKTPAHMKAKDPLDVLENNIPIDYEYYLQNLAKPLLRIFEPILGEVRARSILLEGDHTRIRTIVTPKHFPLLSYCKKTEICLGCKNSLPLNAQKMSVCSHCVPNESIIYQKEIAIQRSLESKYSRLWTECQRCQGSLHEEVLCTNRDCPIFFMRKKVVNDLDIQQNRVQRFGLSSW